MKNPPTYALHADGLELNATSVDRKRRGWYRGSMILLIQDEILDSVAPTPAAKVAYAQAVEEACREVVVGFRTAADGDQVEQRAGCVGALARHPAVYTGAFLREVHERGVEAASDAAAVPMWDESVPMKVSAWEDGT